MKAIKISDNSAKTACSGKFCFLSYSPKSSRPIKLHDSCFCNSSLLNDDLKLKLGLLLRVQDILMLNKKNFDGRGWLAQPRPFFSFYPFLLLRWRNGVEIWSNVCYSGFHYIENKNFVWCCKYAQPRPFFLIFTLLLFITMKIPILLDFWD